MAVWDELWRWVGLHKERDVTRPGAKGPACEFKGCPYLAGGNARDELVMWWKAPEEWRAGTAGEIMSIIVQ